MPSRELPLALRATAERKATLLAGSRRAVSFDALFEDGRVVRDVDVDEVLQGRAFPADAWATRHAAELACPELGTGAWVEYPTGRELPQASAE